MGGLDRAVGDRLEVFWEKEQVWYRGEIREHDPASEHPYLIVYDDGDKEWVRFQTGAKLEVALGDEDEDEDGGELLQRQYKLLSTLAPASTTAKPAPSEPQPAKRKRGRPLGSGGKAAKARATAAASATPMQQRSVQQGAPVAAAAQELRRSPSQKLCVQLAPAPDGSSLRFKLQNMVRGVPSMAGMPAAAPGTAAPSAAVPAFQQSTPRPGSGEPGQGAQPSATPAGAGAANGGLSRLQGEPVAGSSPAAAAVPLHTPSSLPGRDPRRDPRKVGGIASSTTPARSPAVRHGEGHTSMSASPSQPAASSEAPQQQQQQPQQPSRARTAPAVTVIGFQLSRELATVSAGPEQDGAAVALPSSTPGVGSRGTTPGPRRSTSRGSEGLLAGGTPGADAGQGASQEEDAAAGGDGGVGPPSEEEIERQVACRSFEHMLAGLTRTKEAIGRATGLALQAAKCNAGPKLVRMVLERMNAEDNNMQRVNLLYLIDSILQTSVREREGRTDCGPQSPAGQAYPRVVGAALTRLVEAVARDVQSTEKLEKVFLIWQRKAIINDALLQPALLQARTKRAQHDSAWGDMDLSVHPTSSGLGASRAAAGGIPGLRDAAGGQLVAASRKPVAMSGPEGEAWLWRQWRRCPMNTVTIFKFIDQKSGNVVQMTQRRPSNQWEDMDALRAQAEAMGLQLASPSIADLPAAYGASPASSWEEGGSPPPNASPWHWDSMREAKRSAAALAAQQEQSRRAADEALAAAQAAHWAQVAVSNKAVQQQAQRTSSEPDEFDQEMLQQMAGGGAQPATQPGPHTQDMWSHDMLSTMEVDAAGGLHGAASWSLPGAAAAGEGIPPLPARPPPLPSQPEEAGPPPLPDDDFGEGPPPLPAYSPPHDEYAPAEFGGQPPLPPMPPPDEEGDYEPMDLMGASPDSRPPLPPLPPGEAPHHGAAPPLPHPPAEDIEAPLLPPGIGVRRHGAPASAVPPAEAARGPPLTCTAPPRLPHPGPLSDAAPMRSHFPPAPKILVMPGAARPVASNAGPPPETLAAVAAALAGTPHALRSWTGFVSQLVPGSYGVVDGHGSDSAYFNVQAVHGAASVQVGDRVKCEAQSYGESGQYKWRITSIRLDPGDVDMGMDEDGLDFADHAAFGHTPALQHQQYHHQQQHGGSWGSVEPDAMLSELPPGFAPGAYAHQQAQQQQQHWVADVTHGEMDYSENFSAPRMHIHPAMQQQQMQQQQQQAAMMPPWGMQQPAGSTPRAGPPQQQLGLPPGWVPR